MNEYLIIRISNQPQASAPWWVWEDNDRQVIQSGELAGWQDLADLRDLTDGRKTILLINGADVLLKSVTQPKGSGRHLQKMLPFLIEDDVAQDVESLHLSVVSKQADQLLVAGIDRDWFSQVWQLCKDTGLKLVKVLPDVLALPGQPGITLLKWQQQWLVREDEQSAYVIDNEWLNLVSETWLAAGRPITLLTEDEAAGVAEHANWQIQSVDSESALLFTGAINAPFSLLTGPYKISGAAKMHWQIWHKAVYAALALTFIYGANSYIKVSQLQAQSLALRTESERIFHLVFPGKSRIPTVSYLRRELDNELSRLSGDDSTNGVLTVLDVISDRLSTIKGLRVNRINYDPARSEIRIDLQGSDFQQFESARNAFGKEFTVASGPLNRTENIVLGSLTLKQEP